MALIVVLPEVNQSSLLQKIADVEAAKCRFLTCESICGTKSFVCLFVLCVCVCFLYFWNILGSILLLLFLLNSLFSVESNIHMVNSYSSKLPNMCHFKAKYMLFYFTSKQAKIHTNNIALDGVGHIFK